ncbi:response regulator [Rhizorhapis suberifaciens]|uniref:DNA-binding response OmpR family regulator n=1 Tax=Rhizorhapis suberifaciens TaxID=13656 RepID=A0A840HWN4_9SPHN|nr:response regulator [Rhizorhapis suberifaciens]MBB4641990.1 DNA-binding response OmpR family regulator [Rhizorhapis suberifaciens]
MLFGHDDRIITKILIVEDEPLVAFDNEHLLAQAGYQVVDTVDSYAHAELVIRSADIDLVLADVRLRGRRTGVDVAQLARDRNVSVLFVTANCPTEARHLAVGCLVKPYAPKELLAAIEAIDAIMAGGSPARLPQALMLF